MKNPRSVRLFVLLQTCFVVLGLATAATAAATPPTLSGAAQFNRVNENVQLVIPFTVADPSGDPNTVTLTAATTSEPAVIPLTALVFGGAGTANRTMTVTSLPNTYSAGAFTLVTITEHSAVTGLNNTSTFQLAVYFENQPPVFTPGAATVTVIQNSGSYSSATPWATGIAPSAVPLNALEAAQTVGFIVSNNGNALFSSQPAISTTGFLTFTPAKNASGTATVTVIANDNGPNTAPGSNVSAPVNFNVVITQIGIAPSLSALPAEVMAENGTLSVDVTVTDVNDSFSHVTITGTSATTSLIDATSIVQTAGGVSAVRTLTITPKANQSGSAVVTLSAFNATTGLTGTLTFPVSVNFVNQPPVFTAGANVSVNQNSASYSLAWATAIAPSAAPINPAEAAQSVGFVVSNNNNPLFSVQPAVNPAGTLTFTPALNAKGTATVTVTAKDNGAGPTTTAGTQIFTSNFETPIIPSNSILGVANLSTGTAGGWTFTGVGGFASGNGGPIGPLQAEGGNQYAFIQHPVQGNLSQMQSVSSFSLVAGQAYTVTFYQATRPGYSALTYNVTLNGIGAPTEVFRRTTGVNEGWGHYAATFVATASGNYTVGFNVVSTANPTDDAMFFIDDVAVYGSGSNVSAPVTFTITVVPVSIPPSIAAIAAQTIIEDGVSGAITVNLTDVNGILTQVGLSGASGNSALINSGSFGFAGTTATRTMTITPVAGNFGTTTVTLTATDSGTALSSSVTFPVTVSLKNHAPTFALAGSPNQAALNTAGAQTVAGEVTAILPGGGASGEGSQVVNFIVSNTSNGIFTVQPAISSAGALTFTPKPGTFGTATVSVIAHDNGGVANGGSDTSSPQSFTITVNPDTTVPPVIATIPAQQVAENGTLGPINFTVTDVNSDPTNITFSGTSTAVGLVNSTSFTFGGSAGARSVSVSPLPNQFGTTSVTITATNNLTHTTSSTSFVLGVSFKNQAPVFTSGGAVSANQNSGAYSHAWATGIAASAAPINANEAAQSVGFVVANNNNGLFLVQPAITPLGVLTFQSALNAQGTASVTAQLKDSGTTGAGETNASIQQTFTITIIAVAIPPSVSVIGAQTAVEDGTSSPLNLTLGDINDSVTNLVLLGTSSNTGLVNSASFTFGGTGSARTMTITPVAANFGTTTATVTVSNTVTLLVSSTTFSVNVLFKNHAPSFAFRTPANAVVNGDFETGSLAGWTTTATQIGRSAWLADNGTLHSGANGPVAVPHGVFAATETSGGGARLLYQDITLGSGAQTLTMIVYYQNDSGSFFTPATLDTTTGQNQQYRIDLVSTSADPLSVAPADVFTNLFITSPGSPSSLAPTPMTFDVSAFAGQTVRLRFAEADNQFFFQAWVDNVQLLGAGANQSVLNTGGAQSVTGQIASFSPGPASESSQVVNFIVSNDNNAIFTVQPAINAAGTLTYTPKVGTHGSATVSVLAHDNGGVANAGSDTSATQTFTITVNPDTSVPPVISPFSPQQVAENGSLGPVSFTVTDINDDPTNVVFSGDSSVTGLVSSASFTFGGSAGSRTVTIAPLPNQFGNTIVTITASNMVTHSVGTTTFTLGVNLRNQAPVFTAGGDVVVNQNSGAYSSTWASGIAPSAAPINPIELAQTVGFTVSNNNGALFSVQPAISPAGLLTFQPALNATGSSTVTAQLKDSGTTGVGETNASVQLTFNITVTAVGIPPTLSAIGFQHVPESGSSSLLSINLGDVNDSVTHLVLSGTSSDTTILPPLGFTFGGTGAVHTVILTPLPQTFGQVVATIGVSNSVTGLTNSTSFTVSVDFRNQAPIFTPGANVSVNTNSGPYSALWATGITPGPANESSQTVGFMVSDNNNSLFSVQPAVSPTGVLTFTPALNATGTATVLAQLKDNGQSNAGETNGSAQVSFTITVAAPPSPFAADDVYFTGGNHMYKLQTGDNSSDVAFATLPAPSIGKIAWSADLLTAYIPLTDGSVCTVSATGVTTPNFATGLPGTPIGIARVAYDDHFFVATGSAVFDITGGGDFSCAIPAASGFTDAKTLSVFLGARYAAINVADAATHEITQFAEGGVEPTFEFASIPAGPDDITQQSNDSSGIILVTDRINPLTGFIYVVTPGTGGNVVSTFASGELFYSLVVTSSGQMLSSDYSNSVWDVTAGGTITGTPFAIGLPGAGVKVYLSVVPRLVGPQ